LRNIVGAALAPQRCSLHDGAAAFGRVEPIMELRPDVARRNTVILASRPKMPHTGAAFIHPNRLSAS
jgi:hypothetical protein